MADYKNVRCLIDFDGTVANSLVWYNNALDDMYMGKLTDKHYVEHYKAFGDAYEIIPGSPWKRILSLLCQFLAEEMIIGAKDSQNQYLPKTYYYDLGVITAMLKVAWDAEPIEHTPDNLFMYSAPSNKLIACSLDDMTVLSHAQAAEEYAREKGFVDYSILVPNEYVGLTQEARDIYNDKFFYMPDVEKKLEKTFETLACEVMKKRTFKELGIYPVIEFCKQFKEAGGSIVIQSGSNTAIVKAMVESLDITDLFDGIYCSPDIELVDDGNLSPWAYKTAIIAKAMEDFNDGKKCFVLGDTKGDAFGAYENDLPFFLCWRGYPSDPTKLSSADGGHLVVENWCDTTQELLDANDDDFFTDHIEKMMGFAADVADGKVSTPVMSQE